MEPMIVSADCGYNLWAQSYDRELNPLLALEERLLIPILPDLKGSRVLDLACGTGRWLATLLRLGASSGIGIDFSPSMLSAAGSKPLLRGRLVRADGLALPVRASAADLIVCSFAIGHFREVHRLAAELARVARPAATVYVSDVHPEAYQRGYLRTRFRANGNSVEIISFSRPLERIFAAFARQGFAIEGLIEGRLGEAERSVFEWAGRLEHFHEIKPLPVIFIARFVREVSAKR
jgi:ubiquinone/menaquinone biosynthesis C-methylase UbiE